MLLARAVKNRAIASSDSRLLQPQSLPSVCGALRGGRPLLQQPQPGAASAAAVTGGAKGLIKPDSTSRSLSLGSKCHIANCSPML